MSHAGVSVYGRKFSSIPATDLWQWLLARTKFGPGCWIWTGHTVCDGYGSICFRDQRKQAHRVYYELLVGPIRRGLTIDHLCRNHSCVNPAHMEPVTHRENILRGVGPAAQNARKLKCRRGHPFSGRNLRITREGWRACRACHRRNAAASRRRLANGR